MTTNCNYETKIVLHVVIGPDGINYYADMEALGIKCSLFESLLDRPEESKRFSTILKAHTVRRYVLDSIVTVKCQCYIRGEGYCTQRAVERIGTYRVLFFFS